MVSKRAWTAVCAAVAVAVPIVPWPTVPVAGADETVFVEGPDRVVIDANGDGRFVLTSGLVGGPVSVIDRLTGEVRTVAQANAFSKLSADGQHVMIVSSAKLTVNDADETDDVFRVTIANGAVTLMTPGQPGWEFSQLGDVSTDGERVVVGATNSGLASVAAFLGSPSSTVELGTGLGNPIDQPLSGIAHGISGDGNVVLYSTNRGCPCPGASRTWLENLVTGALVEVTSATGGLLESARLSSNGNAVVAFSGPGRTVVHGAPFRGPLVAIGQWDPAGVAVGGPTISADGAVVTWTQEQPTSFDGGTASAPQVMRWVAPGPATVASAPAGGLPNGNAINGLVTDDGAIVFFTTRATNIAGGTAGTANVFARVYVVIPPVTAGASVYTPRVPVRILDTRIGLGAPAGLPEARTTIRVPVRGVNGVPSDASAVAVQIAAAEGTGVGFVSLTPSGAPVGVTANLNVDTRGKVVANLAVVPVGADGAIDVYVQARTHVIVDLQGWWTPAAGATRAGRYVPVGPSRILDTRPTSAVDHDGTKPAAQGTTVVQVGGRGGVPTTGVTAVAINLAVAETDAPGYVQAAPADALVPGASSTLNVNSRGQVVSAATIVPVDAQGRIAIYTLSSAHLIIDVAGWFTDESAPATTSGMFVPSNPVRRVLDTRPADEGSIEIKPGARSRVDIEASGLAIVGNIAVTETAGPGFVQLGPSRTMVNGATANINPTGVGNTISNAFIAPVDDRLGIYTYASTHIVIDISGYMTR